MRCKFLTYCIDKITACCNVAFRSNILFSILCLGDSVFVSLHLLKLFLLLDIQQVQIISSICFLSNTRYAVFVISIFF